MVPIISQEDFDALTGVLSDKERARLLVYALGLVRSYKWPQNCSREELAQDLTMEAIRKALTGERRWNCAATPNPVDFLRSVIKSLVWNELNKAWHPAAATVPLTEDQLATGDFAAESDNRLVNEQLIMRIIGELDEDAVAQSVLGQVIDGITSPSEISERLGLDMTVVLAAKKRIRRAAEKVRGDEPDRET